MILQFDGYCDKRIGGGYSHGLQLRHAKDEYKSFLSIVGEYITQNKLKSLELRAIAYYRQHLDDGFGVWEHCLASAFGFEGELCFSPIRAPFVNEERWYDPIEGYRVQAGDGPRENYDIEPPLTEEELWTCYYGISQVWKAKGREWLSWHGLPDDCITQNEYSG